jgi:nascent polypeptide-associated complex subunit alpha
MKQAKSEQDVVVRKEQEQPCAFYSGGGSQIPMLPGVNPRQMRQMMKQMGIQQQDIEDAVRVEIVCESRKIVIEPCQVAAVNMMGQKTWQVSGEAREESLDAKAEISDEDVRTVAEQAGVSEKEARQAIEEAEGDLAAAILKLRAD